MPRANIIPFQPFLVQVLPTILGSVDYRNWSEQLQAINHLLVQSGLEKKLLESDLKKRPARGDTASAQAQQNHLLHASRALRCNIARLLLGEDFRGSLCAWPIVAVPELLRLQPRGSHQSARQIPGFGAALGCECCTGLVRKPWRTLAA